MLTARVAKESKQIKRENPGESAHTQIICVIRDGFALSEIGTALRYDSDIDCQALRPARGHTFSNGSANTCSALSVHRGTRPSVPRSWMACIAPDLGAPLRTVAELSAVAAETAAALHANLLEGLLLELRGFVLRLLPSVPTSAVQVKHPKLLRKSEHLLRRGSAWQGPVPVLLQARGVQCWQGHAPMCGAAMPVDHHLPSGTPRFHGSLWYHRLLPRTRQIMYLRDRQGKRAPIPPPCADGALGTNCRRALATLGRFFPHSAHTPRGGGLEGPRHS